MAQTIGNPTGALAPGGVMGGPNPTALRQAALMHAAQQRVTAGTASVADWQTLHPGLNPTQNAASYKKSFLGISSNVPIPNGGVGHPSSLAGGWTAPTPTHGPGNPAWEALHKTQLAARAASANSGGNAAGTTSSSAPSATTTPATGTTTSTLANGTTVVNPPIITSLMSSLPSFEQTTAQVQGLYAPALQSLRDMQNSAVHAASLRAADIQSYQDFVTKQAQQAQDLMDKTNQGYTRLVNNQADTVGSTLSDAQNIVAQNSGLAAESGLAGAVQASGNTLGAATTTAQGAATTAQAQGASAMAGQKYAMDMAANERIAAQNAQANLEVNTFLPKMLEIQQAIPAAVSGLYTTELQRGIEAGKIAMAGQIANIKVQGN